MKRNLFTLLALALFVAATTGGAAAADDKGLAAVPFTFVGTAPGCAPSPGGSQIVTAAWLGGLGLPDNGGDAALNGTPATRNDPHFGLLLSKNGPTTDCSAAGARITGVKGTIVTATYELGFDYRLGGHCGAGAPRFNVDTDMGFFFVGCANAPQTPAPQDPAQWSRTRSVLTTCGVECFPGPIPLGAKIKTITLIFDEGTDTANNDTQGVGLAVVDNIDINKTLITRGSNADNNKDNGDNGDNGDNNGNGKGG